MSRVSFKDEQVEQREAIADDYLADGDDEGVFEGEQSADPISGSWNRCVMLAKPMY